MGVRVVSEAPRAPRPVPARGRRPLGVALRPASVGDLPAINAVVAAAAGSWALPERVLRLSLPSLLYRESDIAHMGAVIARRDRVTVAVATWEAAAEADAPRGRTALLVHGIYVAPPRQRSGIGRALIEHVDAVAGRLRLDGLVVKAWRDSEGFFAALGFTRLHGTGGEGLHPRRMWRPR